MAFHPKWAIVMRALVLFGIVLCATICINERDSCKLKTGKSVLVALPPRPLLAKW